MKKLLLLTAVAALMGSAAQAAPLAQLQASPVAPSITLPASLNTNGMLRSQEMTYDFTYCDPASGYATVGVQGTTTYYVAIFLPGDKFEGMQILGEKALINTATGCQDFKIWYAESLGTDQNSTNFLGTTEATATADGMIVGTFPEAYTIPSGGVYVGYSYEVKTLNDYNKYPIIITSNKVANSIFMTFTGNKWNDYCTQFGAAALYVTVKGQVEDVNPEVSMPANNSLGGAITYWSTVGGANVYDMILANEGADDIASIDYTVAYGDAAPATVHYDLPEPLAFKAGSVNIPVELAGGAAAEDGTYTICLTGVNGAAFQGQPMTLAFKTYDWAPFNRPLFEEVTGTGCGYCSRGWMGMKLMNEQEPNYIAIAYHDSTFGTDPMQVTTSFPCNYSGGQPFGNLNRSYPGDPYFGVSGGEFGVQADWRSLQKEFAIASVEATAQINEENPLQIDVNASAKFAQKGPFGRSYKFGYVLTIDGLKGDTQNWKQHNYYANSGVTGLLAPLDTLGEYMAVEFDDVALVTSAAKGVAGSIPSAYTVDTEYTHSKSFTCSMTVKAEDGTNETVLGVKGKTNTNLIQNPENLHMVVFVVDSKNTVINAVRVPVTNPAGIQGVAVDGEAAPDVVSTAYFDLQGRRVMEPAQGLFIEVSTMADGSTQARKINLR